MSDECPVITSVALISGGIAALAYKRRLSRHEAWKSRLPSSKREIYAYNVVHMSSL
jgi:hypothetical protein